MVNNFQNNSISIIETPSLFCTFGLYPFEAIWNSSPVFGTLTQP